MGKEEIIHDNSRQFVFKRKITIKKKIKTWLIHWLGGVTKDEKAKVAQKSYHEGFTCSALKAYQNGYKNAYAEIKQYAESLNGCDADTWCDKVWNYIYEKADS